MYRVIRPDENPDNGLTPKNPNAHYTIEEFVSNGKWRTQFVATTSDINIARKWAAKTNNVIVQINLNFVKTAGLTITDLRHGGDFCPYSKAYNYSRSSKEIVIHGGRIPASAVQIYSYLYN